MFDIYQDLVQYNVSEFWDIVHKWCSMLISTTFSFILCVLLYGMLYKLSFWDNCLPKKVYNMHVPASQNWTLVGWGFDTFPESIFCWNLNFAIAQLGILSIFSSSMVAWANGYLVDRISFTLWSATAMSLAISFEPVTLTIQSGRVWFLLSHSDTVLMLS